MPCLGGRVSFPTPRPIAKPGRCAGIKNPMRRRNSYAGFQIESREQGQASVDKRRRISRDATK